MDIDNLANIMRTESGRQLIAELLALCGEGCHAVSGNPVMDAYSNGRRAIADDILHQVRLIESANQLETGLSLEYIMRREQARRLKEE